MKKIFLSIIVSFFLLTGSKSFAQIFISFEGVAGESKFAAFPSSTQISSFQWGATNQVAAANTGSARVSAGKVQMNDIAITKQRGSASSALQLLVFNGKRIPKAEIRFYKAGTTSPYLTIILEEVTISSWSISASDEAPMESFSLNFIRYKTEDAAIGADVKPGKGNSVSWDISKNTTY